MVAGAAEKNTEEIFCGRSDPGAAGCGDFLGHQNGGPYIWSQPFCEWGGCSLGDSLKPCALRLMTRSTA
jgi:hypothetical protein